MMHYIPPNCRTFELSNLWITDTQLKFYSMLQQRPMLAGITIRTLHVRSKGQGFDCSQVAIM